MDRRYFVRGGVATFASLALSGCHVSGAHGPRPAPVPARRPGPPPHAPAHGYRRRHRSGVDLVFDNRLGVYTVVGMPYYFYGGYFYRHHRGVWQRNRKPRGRWRSADRERVPSRLRKKYDRRRGRRGRRRDRERGRDRR